MTRFAEFDDADHPFRKWWDEHGQYMMAGGGRKESIWAARGWIAREQLACGVEVTGESTRGTSSVPGVEGQRTSRQKDSLQQNGTVYSDAALLRIQEGEIESYRQQFEWLRTEIGAEQWNALISRRAVTTAMPSTIPSSSSPVEITGTGSAQIAEPSSILNERHTKGVPGVEGMSKLWQAEFSEWIRSRPVETIARLFRKSPLDYMREAWHACLLRERSARSLRGAGEPDTISVEEFRQRYPQVHDLWQKYTEPLVIREGWIQFADALLTTSESREQEPEGFGAWRDFSTKLRVKLEASESREQELKCKNEVLIQTIEVGDQCDQESKASIEAMRECLKVAIEWEADYRTRNNLGTRVPDWAQWAEKLVKP